MLVNYALMLAIRVSLMHDKETPVFVLIGIICSLDDCFRALSCSTVHRNHFEKLRPSGGEKPSSLSVFGMLPIVVSAAAVFPTTVSVCVTFLLFLCFKHSQLLWDLVLSSEQHLPLSSPLAGSFCVTYIRPSPLPSFFVSRLG